MDVGLDGRWRDGLERRGRGGDRGRTSLHMKEKKREAGRKGAE